jgi:NAD(P)-dependent dehydrogenase (short-subunit alcohol dehydrogenase family)
LPLPPLPGVVVADKMHIDSRSSEGAVIGMKRLFDLNHAAGGITVNVVYPGEARTPILPPGPAWCNCDPGAGFVGCRSGIPTGRVSEPEEQTMCIRLLTWSNASFMVRAVPSVDRGNTAR